MRAIIDTNVVLDYILNRKGFYEDAEKIMELIKEERIDGSITVKSLTDIHYVIKNATNNEQKTREIIKDVLILLRLLDSKSSDAINALFSPINDYEDALLHETAINFDADYIITRNIKDFQKSKIKILSPKQAIKQLNKS